MLPPERPVVELGVDLRAVIHIVKRSYPSEMRRVLALEERTDGDRAQLLEGLGKIAFEILGEMFPFSFFDRVAAKFHHLKVLQVFDLSHALAGESLVRPSAPGAADERQSEQKP